MPKNQRRQSNGLAQTDKATKFQNDAIMAMLTLMREEQARARRLECKLYARELEYNARKVSPLSDDEESVESHRKAKPKTKNQGTKEKRMDHEEDLDEDETMSHKFKAFLKARSDPQTDTG